MYVYIHNCVVDQKLPISHSPGQSSHLFHDGTCWGGRQGHSPPTRHTHWPPADLYCWCPPHSICLLVSRWLPSQWTAKHHWIQVQCKNAGEIGETTILVLLLYTHSLGDLLTNSLTNSLTHTLIHTYISIFRSLPTTLSLHYHTIPHLSSITPSLTSPLSHYPSPLLYHTIPHLSSITLSLTSRPSHHLSLLLSPKQRACSLFTDHTSRQHSER